MFAVKIRRMKIENFRGLRNELIDFQCPVTVFAGKNGSGKSTVLEAVAIMLSWLPVRISTLPAQAKRIRNSDISIGADYSKITLVLSSDSDKKSDMTLTLVKIADNVRSPRQEQILPRAKSDMSQAAKYGSDMRIILDSPKGAKIDIPVFAYYGANRDSSGTPSPLPGRVSDRTSIYKKAFAAGANFKNFASWFASELSERESEMERASEMPLRKGNIRRDEINERYAALGFVRKALSDFSQTFSGFYVRDGELFLESKNVPVRLLSEGEKTLIALISDIAMRMVVANPWRKNPLETPAIILIDEIDIHLHPDWQAAIAEKLPRIFPNSQFIISSHSPSVMAASRSLYKLNDTRESGKFEEVESPFGRDPAHILNSILNAKRNDAIAAKISEMYSLVDSGSFGEAEALIKQLSREIPNDPDVLRCEYLLRALSGEGAEKK